MAGEQIARGTSWGRRGFLLSALASGGLLIAVAGEARAGAAVGKRAPAITGATTARSTAVSLEKYRGKWVVLSFGASWCAPCKKELPAWQKLAASYRARRAPVVFVAVNIDESTATGRRFVKGLGLRNVCVLYDSESRAVARYDPPKMPTTYVIDPTGVIRHIHPGYRSGDGKELAAQLDRLLAE